jgi:hypothetical protein
MKIEIKTVIYILLFLMINSVLNGQSFNWYSQSDPDWKDSRLGYSKSISIAKSGCVLSCIAMLMNAEAGTGEVTPKTLNTWLKKNHGFIGADMIMEVPPKFDGILEGLEFEARSWERNDWRFLAEQLAIGNKVVVKVGKGKGHWVLVTERDGQLYKPAAYKVNDPALKSYHKRSLAYWGSFRSAVSYSGRWIDDTTVFLTDKISLMTVAKQESFIYQLLDETNFGNASINVYNSLNVPIIGYFILVRLSSTGEPLEVLDYSKSTITPKENTDILFQFTGFDEALINYDDLAVIFSKGYTTNEIPQNGIKLKVRSH